MLGRGIILAALLLWTSVTTALLLRPSAEATAARSAAETAAETVAETTEASAPTGSAYAPVGGAGPYRSVTMQLQRPDWLEKYQKSVDEIAALGADTVMFVVDARMEHAGSRRIYLDLRQTPSVDFLQKLIKHSKDKGLRVILMPIVLLDQPRKVTEWRGTISPDGESLERRTPWELWWESYGQMMNHYAWIAQGSGVDILVVGSELVSTEKQVKEWRKLIADVRSVFKGRLTYSSNWDHYTAVTFWDALDYIGTNSYWSLDQGNKSKATVDDIKAAWQEVQSDLLPFAAKQGKPILFLEIGWFSQANAAHEPWDYTQEAEPVDFGLQERLYRGFFESWWNNRQLGGFSVWEWPPSPDSKDGDFEDQERKWKRGYTPEGKPAEKVLREFMAKPTWKVDPGVGEASGRSGRNPPRVRDAGNR